MTWSSNRSSNINKKAHLPMETKEKAREKLSGKFHYTTGSSKTIICNKFSNIEVKDITRDLKDWIAYLELFTGHIQQLNANINEI